MISQKGLAPHNFKLDMAAPAVVTMERLNGVMDDDMLRDSVYALCSICGDRHKFTRGELVSDPTQPGHADVLNFIAKNPSTQTTIIDIRDIVDMEPTDNYSSN